jgi:hypothetical protein
MFASAVIAAACVAHAQIAILNAVDNDVALVEGDTTTGGNPPDPVIASDSENVLVVVNSMIAVYDKDNLEAAPKVKQLRQFFDVDESDEPFDVSIVWDPGSNPPTSGRFVVSAIRPAPRRLMVAYSDRGVLDANDPLSADDWTVVLNDTDFTDSSCGGAGVSLSVDQTSLGYTADHWWIASFVAAIATDHTDLILMSVDKSSGAVANYRSSTFTNGAGTLGCLSYDDVNTNGRAVARAAVPRGADPPNAYFVGIAPDPEGSDIVRIYAVGGSGATAVSKYDDLEVDAYDPGAFYAPTCNSVDSRDLEVLDGRIASQVYWRDEGDGEFLYCAHAITGSIDINNQPHEQQIIRWYKIKTNGWPGGAGTPEEVESHEFNAGTSTAPAGTVPVHLFFPAIAANADGDVAIVMGQSSLHEKASIQATGREDGETTPTFARTLIKLSDVCTVPDEGGINHGRWGDYFGIALDPDDDTFWVIGEWMVEDGDDPDDGWGIYFANVEVVPD